MSTVSFKGAPSGTQTVIPAMLPLIKLFLELEHYLQASLLVTPEKSPIWWFHVIFHNQNQLCTAWASIRSFQSSLGKQEGTGLGLGSDGRRWQRSVSPAASSLLLAESMFLPHLGSPTSHLISEPVIILASKLSSDSVGSSGITVLGCGSYVAELILVILDTMEMHLEGFHQQGHCSRGCALHEGKASSTGYSQPITEQGGDTRELWDSSDGQWCVGFGLRTP